ncbi:hypothetical protein E2C01_043965 [Portunus trituberculatus]|uniref:Uncharacterized protein n=1 Tax=Portunus trituberculatus TaxID=210409 RepID=A0A5B7FYP1_PORTR|nr:hypothetical protein [Portunus trituberculatus]
METFSTTIRLTHVTSLALRYRSSAVGCPANVIPLGVLVLFLLQLIFQEEVEEEKKEVEEKEEEKQEEEERRT